jgi:hypothetical protein
MPSVRNAALNPPQQALVLCVDEKTQIQALDRTQPTLSRICGQPGKSTAWMTPPSAGSCN